MNSDRECRKGPERMRGESGRAYAAFCVYRDLGDHRSLNAAWRDQLPQNRAATIGKRCPGQWQLWSSRFEWVKRALAYDFERDAVRWTEQVSRALVGVTGTARNIRPLAGRK
jgi:hypothetical protein